MRGIEEAVVGLSLSLSLSLSGLVYIHKRQAEESMEYIRCMHNIVARLRCMVYCKRTLFYGRHKKEMGVAYGLRCEVQTSAVIG